MSEEKITRSLVAADKTLGDSAVDGLLAGVAAGLVMALVMAMAGLLRGEPVLALFRRFALGVEASALSGFLSHVAVSGIYGLIFALVRRGLPWRWRRGWPSPATGVAYGAVLLLLAQSVLLRSSASPLLDLPTAVLVAGHISYGLALGWLLLRTDR